MSEKNLNRKILKLLKHKHAQRIESTCTPGFPDIRFVGGTIESKYVAKMPRCGVAGIRHWRREQRAWHIAEANAGGSSWVIIQVGDKYAIVDGSAWGGTISASQLWTDLAEAMRGWGIL